MLDEARSRSVAARQTVHAARVAVGNAEFG
jgi:hypothetical protein